MVETQRIFGTDIFFKFIEVPFADIDNAGSLVRQIKKNEIAGFIMKSVFSAAQVSQIKGFLETMNENDFMPTPSGKIFPAPFATITDTGQMLDGYYSKLSQLNNYISGNAALKEFTETLDSFFKRVATDYEVSVPINKVKNSAVSPGTFRLFYPNRGGLHVHCGNLFQAQSMFYYSLIKNDIDMNDQLSYFVVLQQSEKGGELTLYDLLWDKAKRKENPENNDFIIDDSDNHLYVKDLRSFAVKPAPGDILVFSGGPIWHRVEDIKGTVPRITFGGFLNFSKDNKELFYWS